MTTTIDKRHRPKTAEQRARLSRLAKARWQALPVEVRARRHRQAAAFYMITKPEIACWPDRWLADLMGGNR